MLQRMLIALVLLLCSVTGALGYVAPRIRSARAASSLQAVGDCNAAPSRPGQGLTTQLTKGTSTAIAAFAAVLLSSPRAGQAKGLQYLKEATPEFTAETARSAKLVAEQKKQRAAWDGLLVKLEAGSSSEELEATLRELRKVLISMPAQIPSGAKKIDLVKTARAKKFLNPDNKRSKKTKPWWTTPVEIEYQALIQQWNKNFMPDNRFEEQIY